MMLPLIMMSAMHAPAAASSSSCARSAQPVTVISSASFHTKHDCTHRAGWQALVRVRAAAAEMLSLRVVRHMSVSAMLGQCQSELAHPKPCCNQELSSARNTCHVDRAVHVSCGVYGTAIAGLMRRELLVLDTCLAAGVPVAGYVGGGYASDLDVLAERHMLLHKAAVQMWEGYELQLGKSAGLSSV